MIVYLDVLIFVNIFEDFLLLITVQRILRLNTKYYRVLLGSLAGGVLSLSALFDLHPIIGFAVKIITSMLLTLISFGYKSKKLYLKTSATLLIVTFLLSGALICFYLAIKPNGMMIINDTAYFDISPLLLIILTLFVYFILLLYRKLFKNHSVSSLTHEVIIRYSNNSDCVKCKTDSGLNVREPFSGSGVMIVEKSSISLYPEREKLRAIPFNSLGGNGIIYGYLPDSITVDGKEVSEKLYVGLCEGIFNTEIRGLIPSEISGE